MPTTLMIDNWLLQDLGHCLTSGLSKDSDIEIKIGKTHSFKKVPEAGVQLEALLGLLADIVLRDEILVDQKFAYTWSNNNAFSTATKMGLLRPVEFLARGDDLKEPTKCIVKDLCITPSLVKAQAQNEKSWKENNRPANQYMSQVIWGTAGMLSRSHVFEVPYFGHPLRRRFLEQTIGYGFRRDVVKETINWTLSERMRIFEGNVADRRFRRSVLVLPLVAMEVINEASSIDRLIPTAVQLRDRHQHLRDWLKEVQCAIDSDDPKGMVKYKKTLTAISKDLNRELGKGEELSVSVSLGMSGIGASLKAFTIDKILKRFGIRAVLHKHVFAAKGDAAIKKLLKMFGEERSTIGLKSTKYLHSHMGLELGRAANNGTD